MEAISSGARPVSASAASIRARSSGASTAPARTRPTASPNSRTPSASAARPAASWRGEAERGSSSTRIVPAAAATAALSAWLSPNSAARNRVGTSAANSGTRSACGRLASVRAASRATSSARARHGSTVRAASSGIMARLRRTCSSPSENTIDLRANSHSSGPAASGWRALSSAIVSGISATLEPAVHQRGAHVVVAGQHPHPHRAVDRVVAAQLGVLRVGIVEEAAPERVEARQRHGGGRVHAQARAPAFQPGSSKARRSSTILPIRKPADESRR